MWERKEVAKDELDKIAKEIKLGIDKAVSEEKASIEKKVRQETMPAASAAGKIPVPEPEKLQEFPRRRA